MRIHTDTLTYTGLDTARITALADDVYVERTRHGSRKRDHAFELSLEAEPGVDLHGIKRSFTRNTGRYGADHGSPYRAATWVEWGDLLCELFKIDPDMVAGTYDGAADFVRQTNAAAAHRPKRENAAKHAAKWAVWLAFPAWTVDAEYPDNGQRYTEVVYAKDVDGAIREAVRLCRDANEVDPEDDDPIIVQTVIKGEVEIAYAA